MNAPSTLVHSHDSALFLGPFGFLATKKATFTRPNNRFASAVDIDF
jgi:hypothetical protein